MRQRAQIMADIQRLQQELARVTRFGVDDHYDGIVLAYTAPGYVSNKTGLQQLTYVAIKKGGAWWVSNGQNRSYSWDALCELMAESEFVWKAGSWSQL